DLNGISRLETGQAGVAAYKQGSGGKAARQACFPALEDFGFLMDENDIVITHRPESRVADEKTVIGKILADAAQIGQQPWRRILFDAVDLPQGQKLGGVEHEIAITGAQL